MTRPIYEKPEDLKNEREIIDSWCKIIGSNHGAEIKAFKLPVFRYVIDFAITDCNDRLIGWAEVKARDQKSLGNFKSYWISAYKITRGEALAMSSGMPFYLIIRGSDGIFYCKMSNVMVIEREITISGRVDREDPDDIEPMIHIPMSHFVKLGGE